MAIDLSKSELAELLGGKISENSKDLKISTVEFDSRKVGEGQLFLCLKGENSHGHQYLDKAISQGASLALVEDESLLDSEHSDRLIVVDDTLAAFHKLASHKRSRLKCPVLALTGSVGKTTTKELCDSILSQCSKGYSSIKSFNNHVGVPYSICNAPLDSNWLVLEIGMNHEGELSHLTQIARPDVALITTVAPVHIGFFRGLSHIADVKCEILQGLNDAGTVVLHRDCPELLSAFEKVKKDSWRTVYFSQDLKSEVQVLSFESHGLSGSSFVIDVFGNEMRVETKLIGSHNGINIAAAIAACRSLMPQISIDQIQHGVKSCEPPAMRLNVTKLPNGSSIIDDSYNANPVGVKASLRLLKELAGSTRHGAILGDMLELGDFSAGYHQEIADFAAPMGLDFVVTVGSDSSIIAESCKNQGIEVKVADSPEQAAEFVRDFGFDLLLVKGSRGIGLERAIAALRTPA